MQLPQGNKPVEPESTKEGCRNTKATLLLKQLHKLIGKLDTEQKAAYAVKFLSIVTAEEDTTVTESEEDDGIGIIITNPIDRLTNGIASKAQSGVVARATKSGRKKTWLAQISAPRTQTFMAAFAG